MAHIDDSSKKGVLWYLKMMKHILQEYTYIGLSVCAETSNDQARPRAHFSFFFFFFSCRILEAANTYICSERSISMSREVPPKQKKKKKMLTGFSRNAMVAEAEMKEDVEEARSFGLLRVWFEYRRFC